MSAQKISVFSNSEYSRCYYLGEKPPSVSVLYKYMDMEALLHSIYDNTLRFVEPTEWKDQYERRFYGADYSMITGTRNRTDKNPPLYAGCFTRTKNDESASLLYCYGKSGIASICVQLQLSISGMRKELCKYAKKNGFQVYEGQVDYSMSESMLKKLHLRSIGGEDNTRYNEFFPDFDLSKYLSLLLLKRPAFKHEMEHRFFIVPDNQEKYGSVNKECFIRLPWMDIVKGVSVMQKCSQFEMDLLSQACERAGFSVSPRMVDLYNNPDERIVIGSTE